MDKWPSDKIERKSTDKLIPYARNSRTHSEEQIAQIAASIKEWGFTTPILVDEDNEIIAGHGRLLAAQKLNIKEVPVMVAEGWTEAQKKAYVIADNQLALNAGWDNEMLKIELKELEDLNFSLPLIGFSVSELTDLFFDANFNPASEDEQGKLDELDPKMVKCPNCAEQFDLREHG